MTADDLSLRAPDLAPSRRRPIGCADCLDGETLVVEQEALGKVLRRRATLNFEGDNLSFEIQDQVTGSVDIYRAKMSALPPARGQ